MAETINLLTIPEAAEKYKLSKYTIRAWSKSGELKVIHSGKRTYIYEQALIDFLTGSTNKSKE